MTAIDILFIIGLIAALIEEWQAQGRAIGWWGVIAVCVGLLAGHVIDL